jgi:hypothetical protein
VNGEQFLFDFAEDLTKKDRMKTATGKTLDRLLATYRNLTDEEVRGIIDKLEPDLRREYKKAYYSYINGGYKKYHPGVKAYRIEDMKAAYRKEVQNSVDNSIALIKTQNQEFIRKMQDRFRNWATIPSNDMRGFSDNPEKVMSYLRNGVLNIPEERKEMTNHQRFIVVDQTRKLISNMNAITAKEAGSFAFIWHNRRDAKVTGRPGGKNKPTPAHGDHWEREGKLYLVRDSWAVKKGLVKKVPGVEFAEDIEDGRPGIPIACRCYAEYISNIEDVPEQYRDILTASGREYLGG